MAFSNDASLFVISIMYSLIIGVPLATLTPLHQQYVEHTHTLTSAVLVEALRPTACNQPNRRAESEPPGLCCRGLHIFKTMMNFNVTPPREAVLPARLSLSHPPSHAISLLLCLSVSHSSGETQAELLIHDMKM